MTFEDDIFYSGRTASEVQYEVTVASFALPSGDPGDLIWVLVGSPDDTPPIPAGWTMADPVSGSGAPGEMSWRSLYRVREAGDTHVQFSFGSEQGLVAALIHCVPLPGGFTFDASVLYSGGDGTDQVTFSEPVESDTGYLLIPHAIGSVQFTPEPDEVSWGWFIAGSHDSVMSFGFFGHELPAGPYGVVLDDYASGSRYLTIARRLRFALSAPPVTGGWRVGRIGFATAAPSESTIRLQNVGYSGDIPEGTVTFAILRDAAQTSIDDFGSLTGIAILHTETSGSWEFTVYRCDPASNTSVTVSGWPWFVIAPAWTADGTVAATGVQVFTDADWGANPINATVTPAHQVAFLFGWTGTGAGSVDTTGGDFSMQALDLDTHMLSFWYREPEDWEDPYPTGPGSLTADFQPPGQLERPVGGYRFVRVDLLES